MDNKITFGKENVNETLYNWAIQSQLLKIAFGIENIKDIDDSLHNFFFGEPEEKVIAGSNLYRKLWGAHCQFGPQPLIKLLQECEYDNTFYKKYREHTKHPLYVCLLGLYIYEKNITIKNSFEEFVIKIKKDNSSLKYSTEDLFVFTWLLSSLYHDIGYLLENEKIKDQKSQLHQDFMNEINKLLKTPLASTLSCKITEGKEQKYINKHKIFRPNLISIDDIEAADNFTNLQKASEYSCLAPKDINGIKEYYDFAKTHNTTDVKRLPFRDHGISSALLLLLIWRSFKSYIKDISLTNELDHMYSDCEEYVSNLNKKLESFDPIVETASQAISLHNIDKNIWEKKDIESSEIDFESFNINLKDNKNHHAMPIAFLLKLCDELQDWDRPRNGKLPDEKDDNLYSKNISIIVSNDGIFLRFFKDEEEFVSPDTSMKGRYYELNQKLKKYLNSDDLDGLLNYGKYAKKDEDDAYISDGKEKNPSLYTISITLDRDSILKSDTIKELLLTSMKDKSRNDDQKGEVNFKQDFEHWLETAKKGDAEAQNKTGECCYQGQGVKIDFKEAFKWYKKAAEQGLAEAQKNLGCCYDQGDGVAANKKKAFEWWKKAAEHGNAKAQHNLARCYFHGEGVEINKKEAFEWWKKAAMQAHVVAQSCLAACYHLGNGIEEDKEEALKWWKKAAEQGDIGAQFIVGCYYNNGDGVNEDKEEAFKWWKKAAKQDYAKAQLKIGMCYYNGWGKKVDKKEAFKWYMKAAKQGLAKAQYNVGEYYHYGLLSKENKKEAFKWYMKAAEQGLATAQYNIGVYYYYGLSTKENKKEAFSWYIKAAEQGFAKAQFNVGCYYNKGDGVNEDKKEAFKWWKKAAKQDYAKAQFNVANRYFNGIGVKKNKKEAFSWYIKAAEQGLAKAQFKVSQCYALGLGTDIDLEKSEMWKEKAIKNGYKK